MAQYFKINIHADSVTLNKPDDAMQHVAFKKKIAASSMLHEAKIAYYAFDAAILFASSIGPAVAKAT